MSEIEKTDQDTKQEIGKEQENPAKEQEVHDKEQEVHDKEQEVNDKEQEVNDKEPEEEEQDQDVEQEDDDGEQDYGQEDYEDGGDDDGYYENEDQGQEGADDDEQDQQVEKNIPSTNLTKQQSQKDQGDSQYTCIESFQLTSIVRKMIRQTMDDKGVSSGQSLLLISMLNYNSKKINNPKQEVFDSIFGHQDTPEQLIRAASYKEECLICYTDKDLECLPSCKHFFCRTCLRKYLQESITSGKHDIIGKRCPQQDCKEILDLELVESLIDKSTLLRFEKLLAEDYSAKTGTPKCLNANCDLYYKISTTTDTSQPLDLFCTCGYSQCTHCNLEAHSPLTCKSFEKLFIAIMKIDNILDYWNLPNTKACPQCRILIENQQEKPCRSIVKCQCSFQMCWYCLDNSHLDTDIVCPEESKGDNTLLTKPRKLAKTDMKNDSIPVLYLKYHEKLEQLLNNKSIFDKDAYAGNSDDKSIYSSLGQHNFTDQIFKSFIEYQSFSVFAGFLLKTNEKYKTDFQQFQVDELNKKLISHQELLDNYITAIKAKDNTKLEELKEQIAKSSAVIAKMKTAIAEDVSQEFNERFQERDFIEKEEIVKEIPYYVRSQYDYGNWGYYDMDNRDNYKQQYGHQEIYGNDFMDDRIGVGLQHHRHHNQGVNRNVHGYQQPKQYSMNQHGVNRKNVQDNRQPQFNTQYQGYNSNDLQGFRQHQSNQLNLGLNINDFQEQRQYQQQQQFQQQFQQHDDRDAEEEQEEEKQNIRGVQSQYNEYGQQQQQQQQQQLSMVELCQQYLRDVEQIHQRNRQMQSQQKQKKHDEQEEPFK